MTPEQELANRLACEFLRTEYLTGLHDGAKGGDIELTPNQALAIGRAMRRAQVFAAAAFAEAAKPEHDK